MPYSCYICCGNLERAPQDPENIVGANIACVPCGHLFHTFCLDKWMSNGLPTSKYCPFCSMEIHTKIPLFPTMRYESFHSQNSSADHNNNSFNHDKELMEVTKKIQLLELKEKDLEKLNKVLRNEQEEQMDIAKHQLNDLKKSVELCARFKAYCQQFEDRWENTEGDLSNLQSIQNVIQSLEAHVGDLGEYPVTSDSVEALKNINSILTQELRDSIAQTKAAKEQQALLLQKNSKAHAKIKVLHDTTASLESKVASFKNELEEYQKMNEGIYLWDQ